LTEQLNAGTCQCLICIDRIGTAAPLYCCPACTAPFHLDCARRWARSQAGDDGKIRSWRCPNCQAVVSGRLPSRYTCFCGRCTDPPADPNLAAHSCGAVCGRKTCPHPCTLRCHAGPCPDCAAVVAVRCGCGRTQTDVRCKHRTEAIACAAVCRRLLSCKRHTWSANYYIFFFISLFLITFLS
jgi:transcriptional repressor NF-X1